MPSGRTHALATLVGAASLPLLLTYKGVEVKEAVAVGVGYLVSLLINPDADLNRRFPYRNPGRWPFWIVMFPYSRLLKHRSFLSHFPLIGTALRTLYVMVPVYVVMRLMGLEVSGPFLWVFIGLAISDTIHFVMDVISTSLKRRFHAF